MSGTAPNLSSSRSKSTPVRAIISTLATRSSPSIPPPSDTYEPLVKTVLRRRLLYQIFLYSLVVAWGNVFAWTVWGRGGSSTLGIGRVLVVPFLPLTLLNTAVSWAAGALPAVVLRKVYITAARAPATSPSHLLKGALSRTSTSHAVMTYATSAIITTVIYTTMAYANETSVRGDPRLGLFVKSKKHPHYLSGRFVFLLFSQVVAALGFSLRNIALDRFVFRWPRATLSPNRNWALRLGIVLRTLVVAALLVTITLPSAAILFALARLAFPVLYKVPLAPHILRPFTGHFLRGSWTLLLPLHHFPLLVRAWFLGCTTLLTWESADALFDAFIAQPIAVSHMTTDPNLTLVAGISSSDRTFKYFAYSELKQLAADDSPSSSARRTALFGDQKYTPNLWSRLLREGLLLLGGDYQLFLRRGKPPAPSAPPPAPKSTANLTEVSATPAPLLRKPIYQSTRDSPVRAVVDALASDGSLSQAIEAGAGAGAASIPELFRSVESAVLPPPAKEGVEAGAEGPSGRTLGRARGGIAAVVHGTVRRYAPEWANDLGRRWLGWWAAERTSKAVEACLPSRELDVVVIEVLSHLTCASLTDDSYGVVQRDIPKILEAMLSFLSAIEEYQLQINALYTPPSADDDDDGLHLGTLQEKEALRVEVGKAGETLGLVSDALKEGVARIVRTFGDKLLAYKFPPRTAGKLQGFLDYC